jgi:hypothetical protein
MKSWLVLKELIERRNSHVQLMDALIKLTMEECVCYRHGAKKYKYECSADGCTNIAKQRVVCIKHRAKVKVKLCSTEGCANQAPNGGVCAEDTERK